MPQPDHHPCAQSGLEPGASLLHEEAALFRAQLRKDFATQTRVLTAYVTFYGFAMLITARLIF